MKITAAVVREKGKPFQFEELDLQDPREGGSDGKDSGQRCMPHG